MNGHFLCEAEVRSRLSLGKLDSQIPGQSFRGDELYLVICILAISVVKACATKQQHTPINAPTVRQLEAATVPNDIARKFPSLYRQ